MTCFLSLQNKKHHSFVSLIRWSLPFKMLLIIVFFRLFFPSKPEQHIICLNVNRKSMINKNDPNLDSTLDKLVYVQKWFLDYFSFSCENLYISLLLKDEQTLRSISTMYCSNRLSQTTYNLMKTKAVVFVFPKKCKQKPFLFSFAIAV